ncbi:MAG: deoxyribose-phosphate aldolase [Bacteroidales bacterium]|nr:deoxyribose-phosphate aldolase [Bacteroidales bacterium]
MMETFDKYGYVPAEAEIENKIKSLKNNLDKWCTKDIYKASLGMIDLTSLTSTDTHSKIKAMVEKVNDFNTVYPQYPIPASICVYPNFAKTINDTRSNKNLHITVVGGCFPASQSFLEVKMLECVKAVAEGADEVDIVLALNYFLDGRFDLASKEIRDVKEAITAVNPNVHLKVILETGALVTVENMAEASFLAMEAGADFIKTSTGKIEPAATPMAAWVMCECIKAFNHKTGRKIGFKPAGGIASAKDAVLYYAIVDTILGTEWLIPNYFRFGASRMANNLLSALEGKELKWY